MISIGRKLKWRVYRKLEACPELDPIDDEHDSNSIEREELNHERPDNKGLPVSGKRVDAKNATSGFR